jgi:hypothetical protein
MAAGEPVVKYLLDIWSCVYGTVSLNWHAVYILHDLWKCRNFFFSSKSGKDAGVGMPRAFCWNISNIFNDEHSIIICMSAGASFDHYITSQKSSQPLWTYNRYSLLP